MYPVPLDIDLRVVKMELKEHLTALWVAEGELDRWERCFKTVMFFLKLSHTIVLNTDGEEPSIVMGSDEVGMPPFRLQYYDQVPDRKPEQLPNWLAEDPQVDMVFLHGNERKDYGLQDYASREEPVVKFEHPIRDRD